MGCKAEEKPGEWFVDAMYQQEVTLTFCTSLFSHANVILCESGAVSRAHANNRFMQ